MLQYSYDGFYTLDFSITMELLIFSDPVFSRPNTDYFKMAQVVVFLTIYYLKKSDITTMTFTLVYFQARGRAELSRLIAAEAKIAIKNEYVNNESLKPLKPSLPFGQVPVLKVCFMYLHRIYSH